MHEEGGLQGVALVSMRKNCVPHEKPAVVNAKAFRKDDACKEENIEEFGQPLAKGQSFK